MILDPGDEVWVEEPGFVEARWALTAAGAKLVPVPVDDKGLVVSEGIACARGAADRGDAIAPISTRRQHGPGAASRTAGLGQQERRLGDRGRLQFGVQASGQHDRLAALARSRGAGDLFRTSRRSMMPNLRLGYMVANRHFIEGFSKGRARIDVHTSGIGQLALAEFMREGHLLRHLRGMRRVYAIRRKALIDAITALMPDDLTVSSAVTGLHLVALFTEAMQARMSDREAAALKQAGIHVQPLSQNFLEAADAAGTGVRLRAAAHRGCFTAACENCGLHRQRIPPCAIRPGNTVSYCSYNKGLAEPTAVHSSRQSASAVPVDRLQIRQTISSARIAVQRASRFAPKNPWCAARFSRGSARLRVLSARAQLHQNVQLMARRAALVARWSSGLRQLWPYPEPIALSHARGRWHDRGCMMGALDLALEVALEANDPASGSDVMRS